MKHRLFTILSALSLLLFVAVVGLWVRGYRASDQLHWSRHSQDAGKPEWLRNVVITSFAGGMEFRSIWRKCDPGDRLFPFSDEAPADVRFTTGRVNWHADVPKEEGVVRCAGFVWHRFTADASPGHYACSDHYLVMPCWAAALISGLLPLTVGANAIWRRKHVTRLKRGLCPSCGYDLRATPMRCPECGAGARHVTAAEGA